MPPHLPVIGISRSQSLRIGRGPGNVMAPQFNGGDLPINPDTGSLYTVLYADLGSAQARRDIQHHSAEGAIETVAGSASLAIWCDLFRSSGAAGTDLVVSAGTGYGLSVSGLSGSGGAPSIQSRFYGPVASVTVPGVGANVLTIPTPNATYDRTDQVYVTPAGTLGYLTGALATVAPTYQVFTITQSGGSAGSFQLAFLYNGYTYLTAPIAYTATAATIQTALRSPAGVVSNGVAQNMPLPAAAASSTAGTSISTSGGALGAAAVTVTTVGGLDGGLTNITVVNNTVTGGTVSIATTTAATGGAQAFVPTGLNLPLANIYVPAGAASAAACGITNMVLTS